MNNIKKSPYTELEKYSNKEIFSFTYTLKITDINNKIHNLISIYFVLKSSIINAINIKLMII